MLKSLTKPKPKQASLLQIPITLLLRLQLIGIDINFIAHLVEGFAHVVHAVLFFVELGGIVAHVLRDFHAAKFGAAHGAEVGYF